MAAGNLPSAFVNGGPKLLAKKDYESATRVLGFGLTIDPKSGPLRNNHRIAWVEYIEATLEAGNDAEALAVARRAAEAVPGKDFASPSEWFVRHAENRLKKGWEEGLKVAQRGLVVLDAPERRKLLEWRSGTFRQWSQSLLRADDAEGSSAVLARAYALDPNDKAVVAGIGFHTQEALRSLESKSGAKAAVAHFEALRRDFPKVAAVGEMGASHANRSIRGLSDGGKFADALAAIETYRPLLPDRAQCDEVGGIVYDKWARQLVGKKSWKEALNKYAEGRKAFPKQDLLVGNAVAAVDRWGKTAIDAKKWDEAIGIYEIGLEYHPGNANLLHNKDYCEKMKAKAK